MARNHAQLLTTVWSDPSWVALNGAAQRLYVLLLSQRRLSLIGSLDLLPSRWAKLAADTTVDSILDSLEELEASRFVAVDHDTEEALIRTFVRHDMPSKPKLPNLVKGLWRAYEGIESQPLRSLAVENLPEWVWDDPRCQPPLDAQNRRSDPSTPQVATTGDHDRGVPPSTLHPPPSTAASTGPDSREPSTTEQQRILKACQILTDRHLANQPSRHNPDRHRAATLRGKLGDHTPTAQQLLAADPDLEPDTLAELLEPVKAAAHTTPVDGTLAAARARMATNAARANGTACPSCDDTHFVDSITRPGHVHPCPECRPGHT